MRMIKFSLMNLKHVHPFFGLICCILLSGCTSDPIIEDKADLEKSIESRLSEIDGDFAVAFRNLEDTTKTVLINESEMFHAASTMKKPVMIELFRQHQQRTLSLDDSIRVENQFHSIVDSSRYEMDLEEDSG